MASWVKLFGCLATWLALSRSVLHVRDLQGTSLVATHPNSLQHVGSTFDWLLQAAGFQVFKSSLHCAEVFATQQHTYTHMHIQTADLCANGGAVTIRSTCTRYSSKSASSCLCAHGCCPSHQGSLSQLLSTSHSSKAHCCTGANMLSCLSLTVLQALSCL